MDAFPRRILHSRQHQNSSSRPQRLEHGGAALLRSTRRRIRPQRVSFKLKKAPWPTEPAPLPPTPPPKPVETRQVSLTFNGSAGESVTFKLKNTMKFRKAMDHYSAKVQRPVDQLRFLFGGQRLGFEDTPAAKLLLGPHKMQRINLFGLLDGEDIAIMRNAMRSGAAQRTRIPTRR